MLLKSSNKFLHCGIYVAILLIELMIIHQVSDLPSTLGNWTQKSSEIANFRIPSSNFYGPGAAILMIPFHYFPKYLFAANLFYFGVGVIGYWLLANKCLTNRWKKIALLALPANFYLIWLINSSQDTVFEFSLLVWSLYYLTKKQYIAFGIVTFILCLTRSGYWTYFIITSLLVTFIYHRKLKKFKWQTLIALPLLIIISIFNYVNYQSVSPALESGITAYYSYSKYHYLALPKMDMDVFLSGPKGSFSKDFGPRIPDGASAAEESSIYQKAAINSALTNKKETILGWMQKFDSYFFDVQKVPHLPGSYVLDQQSSQIKIENERLTWPIVFGNLFYLIWRTIFILLVFLSVSFLIFARFIMRIDIFEKLTLSFLTLPYLTGFFPGLLFYTESRFKIVSEIILVPLLIQVIQILVQISRDNPINQNNEQ